MKKALVNTSVASMIYSFNMSSPLSEVKLTIRDISLLTGYRLLEKNGAF